MRVRACVRARVRVVITPRTAPPPPAVHILRGILCGIHFFFGGGGGGGGLLGLPATSGGAGAGEEKVAKVRGRVGVRYQMIPDGAH